MSGHPHDSPRRCPWGESNEWYIPYHDVDWGMHHAGDDARLFEFLVLEGAQAGLNWLSILKKRESYRRAYRGFDPARVARFSPRDVERLLGDSGIIRNRLKVVSSINNAKRLLEVQKEFGSFDAYLLSWTDGRPLVNGWEEQSEVPTRTELSDAVSKDLKKRGFTFVGTTIIYSYLEAVGIVNDHVTSCFRWKEVQGKREAGPRRAPRLLGGCGRAARATVGSHERADRGR